MKNQWIKIVPYKIPASDMPGVYSATTQFGRTVYGYSRSSEEAYNKLINGVSFFDKVLTIGRESLR